MRDRMARGARVAWVLLATGACGTEAVGPDPALEPFVGTWDAVVFNVTADAPPNPVANLLTLGRFWISVEPSGQYTATLEWLGGFAEIGQLTVQNSTTLVLDSNTGPPAPSTYLFAMTDSLVLDGATEFDFNLHGTDEPGQAHMELVRRP
ncbi:MAG: hypothetical protein FJ207_04150 [Gemmatimonadetes bacterium]|nr:hypothetical protein [Gemmatimonadota bacterium]